MDGAIAALAAAPASPAPAPAVAPAAATDSLLLRMEHLEERLEETLLGTQQFGTQL